MGKQLRDLVIKAQIGYKTKTKKKKEIRYWLLTLKEIKKNLSHNLALTSFVNGVEKNTF